MPVKLKPCGHRVFVDPIAVEDAVDLPQGLKDLKFRIQQSTADHELRAVMHIDQGIVREVGPYAWKHPDFGFGLPDWKPWAKPGDKVVFGKYAGKLVTDPVTKKEFFLMNDEDIQAIIEEES